MNRIYLSSPHMSGSEQAHVCDAFASNWIAPLGPHVDAFERELADYVGVPYAVALSSGTAAMHLALRLSGVRPGDDVLCSTLTFCASSHPIIYLGATPVFVDAHPATWNLDPALLREELESASRAGKLPRALVAVDIYGQSADYDAITALCKEYDLTLIEDAAEALGATYKGKMTGAFGKAAVFSFNGNKIITTSGGGMLVSHDRDVVEQARFLAAQARDDAPHYEHTVIGYNYRMSNILAAIGRGQLAVIGERIEARRRNCEFYKTSLADLEGIEFMPEAAYGRCNRWLTCITIDPREFGHSREDVRVALERQNIESRPVWKPMHLQPVYAHCRVRGGAVAEELFRNGLCLPSGSNLSQSDLDRVVSAVHSLGRSHNGKRVVRPRVGAAFRDSGNASFGSGAGSAGSVRQYSGKPERVVASRAGGPDAASSTSAPPPSQKMRRTLPMRISQVRNRYLFGLDLLLTLLTPLMALIIRMEGLEGVALLATPLALFAGITSAVKLIIFHRSGLYSRYWAFAGEKEYVVLVRALVLAWCVEMAVFYALLLPTGILIHGFPRSMPILDGLLTSFLIGGSRLAVRLLYAIGATRHGNHAARPVLIAGAGVAGTMIVDELSANEHLQLTPIGFVDDDPAKIGTVIRGIPVLGALRDLPKILLRYPVAQVIIAMPTAPGKVIRDLVNTCKASSVRSKTIPGLYEILRGSARVEQFRDVQIEDLLRRGSVTTDPALVRRQLKGSRVLVTGAGGSIGSELCRQISGFEPSELVLLGHGENSIFTILRELNETHPGGISFYPVIADIRDRDRMREVFEVYKPEVLFHAAAHKHLPLMEANIPDAVTNNVLGTRVLIDLAERTGVKRFVMISTDKAVNPTSILGVTKRIAELIVQESAKRTGLPFVAVRFGNVLGSRGSVLPIFRHQIEHGGPITVTHPEVRRYFMTIPEAVQLVLQASTIGTGGEVFVLDMGEQIRIADLARDLLRLQGLQEGRDIELSYSGLRPGEKLQEELFFAEEVISQTGHEKILACSNGTAPAPSPAVVGETGYDKPLSMAIHTLVEAARQGDQVTVRQLMKKIVPQFRAGKEESLKPRETDRRAGGSVNPQEGTCMAAGGDTVAAHSTDSQPGR